MIDIRTVSAHEKGDWLPLWRAYLAYYECVLAEDITDTSWKRFHDPGEPIHLIGAFDGEKMIGFAVYVLHRSSWAKVSYCYLEDLFVDEKMRGHGVGRALILEAKNRGIAAGSSRLYWNTKERNVEARRLYDKLGTLGGTVQYMVRLNAPKPEPPAAPPTA